MKVTTVSEWQAIIHALRLEIRRCEVMLGNARRNEMAEGRDLSPVFSDGDS